MSEQTRTGATAQRPECQQARATQRSPDCFSRTRASRSSSLGRGVGLVFLWSALSSSSLFCRFSVLVSRELSRSRECAVATSAIRGVSRGRCAASPCGGKVPPDSRGLLHQELIAPTREACNSSGISPQYVVRSWASPYLLGVLGLRAPPAVTSAIEVLTQTFASRFYGRVQNRTAVQFVDELFGK